MDETTTKIALTEYASCSGCAAKLNFAALRDVLKTIPFYRSPETLIGIETYDDAGVYRISPDLALVQTVDFFPPIVDDPRLFGRIALVNALSDVYAMGGVPLTALNITAFPSKSLPARVLVDILTGGAEACREANVTILGGHTIEDAEIIFGAAITGRVHPDRIFTNRGARPGDRLILTKPVGVGLITTGLKTRVLKESDASEAFKSMTTLNRAASESLTGLPVHACTDITGFGLIGHATGMADASGATIRLRAGAVPIFPAARAVAEQNIFPMGSKNPEIYGPAVTWNVRLSEPERLVLFDPQTSGGLLVAVPAEDSARALAALRKVCPEAALVGEVLPRGKTALEVA